MSELDKASLENCQENDVLRFEDEVCMVANLEAQIQDFFHRYSVNLVDHLRENLKIPTPVRERLTNYEEWFEKGKQCKFLKSGQKWQTCKVKIKLNIEVFPYNPESEESEETNE